MTLWFETWFGFDFVVVRFPFWKPSSFLVTKDDEEIVKFLWDDFFNCSGVLIFFRMRNCEFGGDMSLRADPHLQLRRKGIHFLQSFEHVEPESWLIVFIHHRGSPDFLGFLFFD